MKKTRITLTGLTLVAILAVVYVFATTDSVAEETTVFHLLVVTDGEFTEVSYELSSSELAAYFDGAVLASLLEGNNVVLSSAESIEAASAFADVDGADEVVGRFGPLAMTWGCLKCCYSDTPDCCCPPDTDDPKDPDGD